jgi:hypothetical protein
MAVFIIFPVVQQRAKRQSHDQSSGDNRGLM